MLRRRFRRIHDSWACGGASTDPEFLGGARQSIRGLIGRCPPPRPPRVSLSGNRLIDSAPASRWGLLGPCLGPLAVPNDALAMGPQVSESAVGWGNGAGRLCERGASSGVGASSGGPIQTVYMSCAPEHAHIVLRAIYKMCARDTRRGVEGTIRATEEQK